VKPELVLQGGMILWASMGDAYASIPTPEPVIYRPMFAAFGGAPAVCSLSFVSQAAQAAGIGARLGPARKTIAVSECHKLRKHDKINNNFLPKLEVDAETYEVRADGELLTCEPAAVCRWRRGTFRFERAFDGAASNAAGLRDSRGYAARHHCDDLQRAPMVLSPRDYRCRA
jgi:urease subunit alpha